jgi:hypothetical protein
VKRITGAYVDGRWKTSESATVTVKMSVQPLKSDQWNSLQNEVQGTRLTGAYRIYTNTSLNTAKDGSPDRVVIDGDDYEVFKKDNWVNGVINHKRYIVIKRDRE